MLNSGDEDITTRLARDRVACSFDNVELRAFLAILQERLDAAAELELARFQQNNQSDAEYEQNKNEEQHGKASLKERQVAVSSRMQAIHKSVLSIR